MEQSYLIHADRSVAAVIEGIDKDVERGEDILMLGFGLVLLAPAFAPLLSPKVLLPLMALTFALSSIAARLHFYTMRTRLSGSLTMLDAHQQAMLRPVVDVFVEHPMATLADAFNPMKNLSRTLKSLLGGLMVNPLWMPIFYMMGIQFAEERQLYHLNKAVMAVEQRILPRH